SPASLTRADRPTPTTFIPPSTGTLPSQSHAYGEEGPYTVTVTVTDTVDSLSGSATFTVNVTDPPVVPTGGFTFSGVEGTASSLQKLATFTDPAGAEGAANYSATIDWGDGGAPAAATVTL